jgi:hypothetical protein
MNARPEIIISHHIPSYGDVRRQGDLPFTCLQDRVAHYPQLFARVFTLGVVGNAQGGVFVRELVGTLVVQGVPVVVLGHPGWVSAVGRVHL